MKKTIDSYDFRKEFANMDRADNFSNSALDILFNYYEEIDENMELDVIAICCDWTEYSQEELKADYGYKLDYDEWLENDYVQCDSDTEDDILNEYIEALVKELEDETTVITVDSDTYLVLAF